MRAFTHVDIFIFIYTFRAYQSYVYIYDELMLDLSNVFDEELYLDRFISIILSKDL